MMSITVFPYFSLHKLIDQPQATSRASTSGGQLAQENGLSKDELVEAVTHLAFYAGWPRAASALERLKSQL